MSPLIDTTSPESVQAVNEVACCFLMDAAGMKCTRPFMRPVTVERTVFAHLRKLASVDEVFFA